MIDNNQEELKKKEEIIKSNSFNNNENEKGLNDERRRKRVFTHEEEMKLQQNKKFLDDYVISENPMQNKFLKKMAQKVYNNTNTKEKEIQRLMKKCDLEEKKEREEKAKNNLPDTKNIFYKSELPNEKIDWMEYYSDNSEIDLQELKDKIINKQVDYEKDLEFIFQNIYLSLTLLDMDFQAKLGINSNNSIDQILSLHFQKNTDLHHFIRRSNSYCEKTNDDFTKKEESELESSLNTKVENITFCKDIRSLADLMIKDNYFTAIKHDIGFYSILFLAEIFTEQSQVYKEVSKLTFYNDCFLPLKIFRKQNILSNTY